MRFFKAHSCGNDYVILFKDSEKLDLSSLAKRLCRRHYSIGGDGFIVLSPSESADASFRIFNADGSESEMCGNGIRCAALCLSYFGSYFEVEPCEKSDFSVFSFETAVGRRQVERVGDGIFSAYMGEAEVGESYETVLSSGKRLCVIPVDIGNPHAVIFTEDLTNTTEIFASTSEICDCGGFKDGANLHVAALHEGYITSRTQERGVGETLSCGTGGCAIFAAAESLGMVKDSCVIRQRGGELTVRRESEGLILTGEASLVCEILLP